MEQNRKLRNRPRHGFLTYDKCSILKQGHGSIFNAQIAFSKCYNGYLYEEIKVDYFLHHTQESIPGDLENKSKIKSKVVQISEHKIREHIYDIGTKVKKTQRNTINEKTVSLNWAKMKNI